MAAVWLAVMIVGYDGEFAKSDSHLSDYDVSLTDARSQDTIDFALMNHF